jgi:hypothetical protein
LVKTAKCPARTSEESAMPQERGVEKPLLVGLAWLGSPLGAFAGASLEVEEEMESEGHCGDVCTVVCIV